MTQNDKNTQFVEEPDVNEKRVRTRRRLMLGLFAVLALGVSVMAVIAWTQAKRIQKSDETINMADVVPFRVIPDTNTGTGGYEFSIVLGTTVNPRQIRATAKVAITNLLKSSTHKKVTCRVYSEDWMPGKVPYDLARATYENGRVRVDVRTDLQTYLKNKRRNDRAPR